MARIALALMAFLITTAAFGGGAAVVSAKHVFKAGSYTKIARLGALHADDLGNASRAQNIAGLVALAQAENRANAVDALQWSARYRAVDKGDLLLLTCLRHTTCEPSIFLNISQTSRLHAEVVRRSPGLNPSQAAQQVGATTERLMDRYFQSSGWTRVEGQVGRAGFDGLYIRREGEVIKDVLIAESKYNTSALAPTNHGTQMSDPWIRQKLVELRARYPNDPVYRDVERYVDAGSYRAVLWNMKVDDDALSIKLSRVKSKGGEVDILHLVGTDADDLWAHPTNRIPFDESGNSFEQRLAGWYRAELDALGPATF